MLPIGESSSAFESRNFIRSGEVIPGSGVLTQNMVNAVGTPNNAVLVRVTGIYADPFNQTPVTGISSMYKQSTLASSGNAYYHLNQNLTNVQRFKFLIGE